jgi:hypothetical protein
MHLQTPQPLVAEHALRFEISDHSGRPYPLKRRTPVCTVEGHHPHCPGAPRVIPEYLKIADQVTCGGIAVLPPPSAEGPDLLRSFESVVANGVPQRANKTRAPGYRRCDLHRPSNWLSAD